MMIYLKVHWLALVFAAVALPVLAATPKHAQSPSAARAALVMPPTATQSITQGTVTVDGRRIRYKAIAGIAVITNAKGQPYTSMSYVAYVKDGVGNKANRPITFFYNGGPGSSSVWLHMLAFGPRLVATRNVNSGSVAASAPYKLVNNGESLLDVTDEVFVDAPGTGFGRLITKKMGGVGTPEMVYGIDQDAHTFARFIKQYITRYSRWNSPKYLYGESYGTTRDAVLAYDLTRSGVDLNGVVFQSAVINWNIVLQFARYEPGVSLAYATGFPTEAATAWYHKQIPDRRSNLLGFLDRAERFAMGPYLQALNDGNLLGGAAKRKVAQQMHEYIGLPTEYILKADLRVDGGMFRHKLLSGKAKVVGRLDSRYAGYALDPMAESGKYGPLMSAIVSPVMALFNGYVRNTLAFGNGRKYRASANVNKYWQNVHKEPGVRSGLPLTFIVNVMPDLAHAMKLNPQMKVMVAGGYFDLGTPYYAAKYEFEHLRIPSKLQNNISYHFFKSGHMVYLSPRAHKKLHDAVAAFIKMGHETH